MSGEFDIYGVYFPALVVFAAIAFVFQLGLKRVLDVTGFYRFVWRPLVDLAIYVILLAAITAVATTILPLA